MKGFKRNIHTTMIIAESMRRFQLILCVAVVNALVFQGMQPPFTDLNFVGEYHYQDFISFLKSENRCRFIPMNISSHLENDQSTSNDVCMGFMKTVKNMSAESQIGIFEVKYFAFDVQYNYELKPSSCEFKGNLQHIEMMLICRGKTVNGTRCDKNSACKRKGEVCQGNLMMDDQFCTPTRLLYQSCDGFSQCDRNSECRLLGSKKTCQCMDGYVDINWHCVKSELSLGEKCSYDDQCSFINNASRCLYNETKNIRMCSCVKGYIASGSRCIADGLFLHEFCRENKQCTGTKNANVCKTYGNKTQSTCRCNDKYTEIKSKCYKRNRRLHESCEWSEQCTGSAGANECKYKDGVNICACPEGKNVFNGNCLKSKLTLDEACWVGGQCTGTPNSGVCMPNQDKNGTLLCHCSTGSIRHNSNCLPVGRKLFETCSSREQCNGTDNAWNCTDTHVDNNKVCFCQDGYLNFKGQCIKAGKELNEMCETHQQCTGTDNANTCRLVGNSSICNCNDKFDLMDGKCLKTNRKLNETCNAHQQCTGTDNANTCNFEDGVCRCNNKYTAINGKCLQDKRNLDDMCEINLQCSGTENAGVCGKNQTCTCDEGFIRSKKECLPKKDMLLLLIAVGGFFGILTCLLTISFALKRRNSKTKRLECRSSSNIAVRNIRYSIVDNIAYESTAETSVENRQSHSNALAENIYDEAYQRGEQGTEHVYSCSEPQCYGTQDCDNDIYNHLHQKPIQMSDAIYGVPKSMSESMCSKMQEHRL